MNGQQVCMEQLRCKPACGKAVCLKTTSEPVVPKHSNRGVCVCGVGAF